MKQLLQFQGDDQQQRDPPPRRSRSRQAPQSSSQQQQQQVLQQQQERQPLHRPTDDKYSYLTMQPQSQQQGINPNMIQAHHQTMPQDWSAAATAPLKINNLLQAPPMQIPFEMQSMASAADVISDYPDYHQTYAEVQAQAQYPPQMQYPQQQPAYESQQFQQSPQQQFQQYQEQPPQQQPPIYLVPASQLPSMNPQNPTPFLVLEPRTAMQQQQEQQVPTMLAQDVVVASQHSHEQMLHSGNQGSQHAQQYHNPLDHHQAQPLVPQQFAAPSQHFEPKQHHSSSMDNRRQAQSSHSGTRNPITGQSANDYNYKSGSDISKVLYTIDDLIKTLFSRADRNDADPLNASFDRQCQHVLTDMIAEHPEIPPKMLRSHWYGQMLDHQMKKKNNSGSPVRDKIMKSHSDVALPFKRQLPQNWSSQANPLLGGDGDDHRRIGRRYSPDLHVLKSHHSKSSRSGGSYSPPRIGENNLSPKGNNEGGQKELAQNGGKESFFNKFTDNDKVVAKRNAALESYRRGLDRQMEEKRIRDGKNKKETSPERVPYPQEAPESQSQSQSKRIDSKAVRGQPRSKDISQLRHQFTFRDHEEEQNKKKDLVPQEASDRQEMDAELVRVESGHSLQSAAAHQQRQPLSIHQLNQSANALIQMMQNVVTETVASTQFQHFQIQQLLQAEVGRYPGLDQTAVPLQMNLPFAPFMPHQPPARERLEASSQIQRLPTEDLLKDMPPELQQLWLQKYKYGYDPSYESKAKESGVNVDFTSGGGLSGGKFQDAKSFEAQLRPDQDMVDVNSKNPNYRKVFQPGGPQTPAPEESSLKQDNPDVTGAFPTNETLQEEAKATGDDALTTAPKGVEQTPVVNIDQPTDERPLSKQNRNSAVTVLAEADDDRPIRPMSNQNFQTAEETEGSQIQIAMAPTKSSVGGKSSNFADKIADFKQQITDQRQAIETELTNQDKELAMLSSQRKRRRKPLKVVKNFIPLTKQQPEVGGQPSEGTGGDKAVSFDINIQEEVFDDEGSRVFQGKSANIDETGHRDQTSRLKLTSATPHHMRKEHHRLEIRNEALKFKRNSTQVKRQIPGLEDLEDQHPGAGRLDDGTWNDIVEQERNEFDVYSSNFKPEVAAGGTNDDNTAPQNVFQDDITMPSNFNISQNQYSAALETGDPFQQHMAHVQQSFDQIMHENYQLEQQVNKKYLKMQSTAPGSASEILYNQRVTMGSQDQQQQQPMVSRPVGGAQQNHVNVASSSAEVKALNQSKITLTSAAYNIATDTFEETASQMKLVQLLQAKQSLDVSQIDAEFAQRESNRIGNANGVVSENVYVTPGDQKETVMEDLRAHGAQTVELDLTGAIQLEEEGIDQGGKEAQANSQEDVTQSLSGELQNRLYAKNPLQKQHEKVCDYPDNDAEYNQMTSQLVDDHDRQQRQHYSGEKDESLSRQVPSERMSQLIGETSKSSYRIPSRRTNDKLVDTERRLLIDQLYQDAMIMTQMVTPETSTARDQLVSAASGGDAPSQDYQNGLSRIRETEEYNSSALRKFPSGPNLLGTTVTARSKGSARSNLSQQDIINQHALESSRERKSRQQTKQNHQSLELFPPLSSRNRRLHRSNSVSSAGKSMGAANSKLLQRIPTTKSQKQMQTVKTSLVEQKPEFRLPPLPQQPQRKNPYNLIHK